MDVLITNARRVERFFRRQAKNQAFRFDDAPDPRQLGKVKYAIGSVYGALFGGLLRNDATLRRLESRGGSTAPLSSVYRISDTQLHDLVPRLDQSDLLGKLVDQVKHMHRRKMLKAADLSSAPSPSTAKTLACLATTVAAKATIATRPVAKNGAPKPMAKAIGSPRCYALSW